MTTPKPIESPGAPDAYEPLSRAGKLEEDATLAGLAAAGTLRAVEVAAIVLVGLLVVPPLAILVVVVVLPLLAIALVVALVAAVFTVPYLLVRHLRHHHGGHAPLLAHRLRVAGRAILDLAAPDRRGRAQAPLRGVTPTAGLHRCSVPSSRPRSGRLLVSSRMALSESRGLRGGRSLRRDRGRGR